MGKTFTPSRFQAGCHPPRDKKTEYRLATNLVASGDRAIKLKNRIEISKNMGNRTAVEIYNNAHNLDIIITKNQNKVEIYIYTIILRAYML